MDPSLTNKDLGKYKGECCENNYPQQQKQGLSLHLVEDQSYHYRRYSQLKIKPIDVEDEEDQVATFQEQTNQISDFSLEFSSFKEESPQEANSQLLKNIKNKLIKSSDIRVDPEQWKYIQRQIIHPQCLKYLIEQQKQVYNDISTYVTRMIKGTINTRLLLIKGPNKTGKKTILFEILTKLLQNISNFQHYYFDFQTSSRKGEQKIIQISNFILNLGIQKKKNQLALENQHIFVINNARNFFYIIKHQKLYHSFKTLIRRSKVIMIFVDSNFDIRKQSWLSENSSIVQTSNISLSTMVSIIVFSINNKQFGNIKWNLTRPLAMFYCSKIKEFSTIDFNLLAKINIFLSKQSKCLNNNEEKGEYICQEIKITRERLQKFKSEFFNISLQPNIVKLSLHEKLTLVAIIRILSEEEKLAIEFNELYKMYCWACESISMKCREYKQFRYDILHQMETYKLIKMLNKYGNKIGSFILTCIDRAHISETLRDEPLLSKFL